MMTACLIFTFLKGFGYRVLEIGLFIIDFDADQSFYFYDGSYGSLGLTND